MSFQIKTSHASLAAVFFTSGSTSKPKGVMHSQSSLLAMADNIADCVDLTETDIFLINEAITNASGCSQTMSALCRGGTAAIIDERSNVKELIQGIHKFKATILAIIGKLNFDIINDPNISDHDFESVRINFTGGDRISKEFILAFEQKTKIHLQQGYGMSEILCITANKSRELNKVGSIGKETKKVSISLLNDNLEPIENNMPGIAWVTGPNLMLGYWQNEDLNKSVFKDNWFCTGDLLYQDKEGFYWFYGRAKQLIIRQGDNISPLEIEDLHIQHPAIKIAGVTGKPDPEEGEVPIAFVVLAEGRTATPEEIMSFFSKKIEEYKVPTEIHIVQTLPLTKSNKIDRQKLKEQTSKNN